MAFEIESNEISLSGGNPVSPMVINQFDSVFFDLFQAVINGNTVEFPVYLRSDDVINSLDFALKYDHTQLEYDTLINLTGYIDHLSFYNTNDSTVRLTSYSFTQPYSNDTPLFIIRFTVLAGFTCSNDFNSVSALLNGDLSSHKFEECLFNSIQDDVFSNLSIYPNPVNSFLVVDSPVDAVIDVVDIHGKVVMHQTSVYFGQPLNLDTGKLESGVYFIKMTSGTTAVARKFVVSK